jgi:hypothetical protein
MCINNINRDSFLFLTVMKVSQHYMLQVKRSMYSITSKYVLERNKGIVIIKELIKIPKERKYKIHSFLEFLQPVLTNYCIVTLTSHLKNKYLFIF